MKLLPQLSSMSERERRLLLGGVALLVVLLVFGVVMPLEQSVTKIHQRVGKKEADLAWMKTVAPELIGAAPPPTNAGESLVVIIERSAHEAGIASSITANEPSGRDGISVRLEKAPFDQLVAWLARLAQQNGIRVDTAQIDSAGAPGIVNASVVLRTG